MVLQPHPQLTIISKEEMDNYDVYSKLDYSKRLQSLQAKKELDI